jgi:Ca2+-binding RTX toxin-like protein
VGVNNGVLQIVGTGQGDHITVNGQGAGRLKVDADFLTDSFRTFSADEVDRIVAYLFEGDDHLTISASVTVPAIVHGGSDNDRLNGGGGPTVLLGDSGEDTLIGADARSILIGGSGADRLIGGAEGDVLIGGSSNVDDSDAALWEALEAWDSLDHYDLRSLAVDSLLDALDDEESDRMTGGAGRDLWFDGVSDSLLDVRLANPQEDVL